MTAEIERREKRIAELEGQLAEIKLRGIKRGLAESEAEKREAVLEKQKTSWMADANRYAFTIGQLKPKVRELEGKLAERTNEREVYAKESAGMQKLLVKAEKREAVLEKALEAVILCPHVPTLQGCFCDREARAALEVSDG